ncbi:hypothetical protein D479_12388 [Halobacillus sp. BAB-2008]|nr:hypothetical protein D479_12388 [Halobacillus sp. BAB-2008]
MHPVQKESEEELSGCTGKTAPGDEGDDKYDSTRKPAFPLSLAVKTSVDELFSYEEEKK